MVWNCPFTYSIPSILQNPATACRKRLLRYVPEILSSALYMNQELIIVTDFTYLPHSAADDIIVMTTSLHVFSRLAPVKQSSFCHKFSIARRSMGQEFSTRTVSVVAFARLNGRLETPHAIMKTTRALVSISQSNLISRSYLAVRNQTIACAKTLESRYAGR